MHCRQQRLGNARICGLRKGNNIPGQMPERMQQLTCMKSSTTFLRAAGSLALMRSLSS